MLKKYWEIIKAWLNDNDVQTTWFFIGFLFADLLTRISKIDIWGIYDIIIIALLYATRKVKFR